MSGHVQTLDALVGDVVLPMVWPASQCRSSSAARAVAWLVSGVRKQHTERIKYHVFETAGARYANTSNDK